MHRTMGEKNEISSEGIAQLIRCLIRRCQMPAHNTIPHTARRCIATWRHHIGREMHWWEEGGKKETYSEGTQEEKWITVRGRVDWRTGRLGEPICRLSSFPLPCEAWEAKCCTNICDHTETYCIWYWEKRKPGRFRDNFVKMMQITGVTRSIRHSC